MSKAFTRESDDVPERPVLPRLPALLPPGAKNYLTPDGARRFQDELRRLLDQERSQVASSNDRHAPQQSEARRQRIQHLERCLHAAEIVPSPAQPWDQVRFGGTVTVRDGKDDQTCYRIVGAAETDADRGWVSCFSPIARALLNAKLGQRVRFKFPSGEEWLEIVNISYE